jgi:nicotinate-nucleotide adenylyltransferase
VDIIVAGRTGEDYDAVLGSGYRSIDNTRLPVSSSDIRSRIGAGRAYRYLVPEAVYDYIRHHHLYQDAYADSDG